MSSSDTTLALVLGGGGARTAYQAGVLRYLGEAFPGRPPSLVVASGAGALNAGLLAGRARPWSEATAGLVDVWTDRRPGRVFEPRPLWSLVTQLVRHAPSDQQSLLDPAPLRRHLEEQLPTEKGELTGVRGLLADGWLEALAVTTAEYETLRTVTWTQGRTLDDWPHERRAARSTTFTIDHLMASSALSLLYPAVSIEDSWHGTGVGMLHPLAPALRLGADRILAIGARADVAHSVSGDAYPSPLQIASLLSNTLLLDTLEADAAMLGRIDHLARRLSPEDRGGLEPVDTHLIRPSVDLTAVAEAVDPSIGEALGTVLQYLHTGGPELPDLMSLLLYEPDYLRRLLLLGHEDARRQHDQIVRILRH